LEDNELNESDLYIRATDCSSNQNTQESGPYGFTKDLAAPVFTSEVSGNLTKKAILKLTAPEQTVSEEVYGESELPAVVLIMLEEAEGYSVKTVSADSDIWIENVFDSEEDSWTRRAGLLKKLLEGTYYGEANVKIVMGYGISFKDGKVKKLGDEKLSEQEHILYTAPSQDKIHNIVMTSSVRNLRDGWSSPDDGAKYYTDLAGCTFNISVSNALMEKWGARDMDFSNSYFALCKDNGNGEEIYQTPIGMSAQISIPAGLNLEKGEYYAKAVVKAKTSGQVDEARSRNIEVDVTKPSDFGLAKTESEIIFKDSITCPPPIDKKTAYYGYYAVDNLDNPDKSYGSAPQLFLGSATDEIIQEVKHRLYFTTLSTNEEMYIKLWNASQGVDTKDSKRVAKWLPVGNKSSNAFNVIIVDSAEDVISNYDGYNIPLINNEENIVYYQVCHANGESSGERVMLINVSDEKAELEVELTSEDKPSQTVTATVTKLESISTPELEVMYWNGTDTLKVIGDIDILQRDNNWFYTQNVYGNYTFLNKEAAQLDNEGPSISTSQDQSEGDGYAISVFIYDENPFELFFKFDDDYMSQLGLDGYFVLDIPQEDGVWVEKNISKNGIYKIERRDTGSEIELIIYGVYLFDQNAA
ncbi:MAG TPA: hypothetical protein GX519_03055, partial [Thermoanaerobacterales bacterium]|nr:hypothetical protein [Thermoanaerobacterales bacterium]